MLQKNKENIQQQQADEENPNEHLEKNKTLDQIQEDALRRVDPKNLNPGQMYLSVSGVIESAQCEDESTLQVEYSVVFGDDWEVKDAAKKPSGISQKSTSYSLHNRDIVFNFPFETTLATTSAYGWPQLILTVKGPDIFGRFVIKGYGSVHFPTQPGTHERTVRIYQTLPMSWFQGFFGYLDKNMAKYNESEKVIASGEGRDVTRVKSVGTIKVRFEVMKRNFQNFGYSY